MLITYNCMIFHKKFLLHDNFFLSSILLQYKHASCPQCSKWNVSSQARQTWRKNVKDNYSITRRVARIWKRGGLFWKSEKCANDVDSNFHWPWISFRWFVRNLRRNVSERSEIQRFFPPKIRWSPKKKKKKKRSSPKFRVIFRPKSEIQTFFLPKIRWSPKKKKKKKKKKKSSPKFQSGFPAEIRNSNVFSAQNQVISKKKKKKKTVFAKIHGDFSPNFATSNVWGGAIFEWGGYFPFFTENRPQNHKKHAFLHTSQANGGGSSPPRPPPGYATEYNNIFIFLPSILYYMAELLVLLRSFLPGSVFYEEDPRRSWGCKCVGWRSGFSGAADYCLHPSPRQC